MMKIADYQSYNFLQPLFRALEVLHPLQYNKSCEISLNILLDSINFINHCLKYILYKSAQKIYKNLHLIIKHTMINYYYY